MTILQRLVWAGCLGSAAAVWAEDKMLTPEQQWAGSVQDAGLLGKPPVAVTTTKAWETQWKAWKLEGDAPKVDFEKQLIVVQTTSGGRLNLIVK